MLQHLQPLIKKSVTRRYTSGSTILYQGEVPRVAYILVSGLVKVHNISSQGDEQIVTHHVPGEFFPSSWVFNKATGTVFFYTAVTNCEIAFVPREELTEFLFAAPERISTLLDYYVTSFSASLIRINALEQPKARDKLTYTLYYLCQRYGKQSALKVHIPLALTHQNLASLVGLTRETTATEMSKLRKQKVISYENQKYIVNMERLLDLIGEDSFRGISIRT